MPLMDDPTDGWLHPGDEGYPYEEMINDPKPVCSQCSIHDAHEWCVASFMIDTKCYCTSPEHYQNQYERGASS